MEPETFQSLLRRVRDGDAAAAEQLVRAYEPEIRRYARMRLTDSSLRRVLESVDVCQSVLANFYVRAAAGALDVERPEQLLKMLAAMVRNKIIDHARRQNAARRDQRRQEGLDADHVAVNEQTPSRIVAGQELLAEALRRLTPAERYLVDQRRLDRPWAELAAELGEEAQTLRKRHSRALDRVASELGLEGGHA
jgi:RNA polymerase sigma-70 factor (ECF subfamily)